MIIDSETLLNLKKALTLDLKIRLFFLIFLLIFVALLEMLVLSLVPLYVALLINPKKDLEIIDINVNDLISNIYPGDTVTGFSIILICAFGFKLVFVLSITSIPLPHCPSCRFNKIFGGRSFNKTSSFNLFLKSFKR